MKHPFPCQLIAALDVDTLDHARDIMDRMGSAVPWVKVGHQLFTRHGPEAVKLAKSMGKKVFLDLKYHDIPNTVAQAVRSAGALGADMTNVHAGGGPEMLRAAAAAAAESDVILVAVTVLTSMDGAELEAVGCTATPAEQVLRLAGITHSSGVAGVVCSALEIRPIRQAVGAEFVLVVPGIRPAGAAHGDQKRVMTPAEAVRAGADFIVVGRPITQAQNPAAAAESILAEMAEA